MALKYKQNKSFPLLTGQEHLKKSGRRDLTERPDAAKPPCSCHAHVECAPLPHTARTHTQQESYNKSTRRYQLPFSTEALQKIQINDILLCYTHYDLKINERYAVKMPFWISIPTGN